jgi:hypothetical protein
MKKIVFIMALLINIAAIKLKIRRPLLKRVLENTEVDVLLSYYNQDGVHSAVNGGIGKNYLISKHCSSAK